jgi:hypothetical protein
MKTNIKICMALLSIGLCVWSTQAFGQGTTTTVTTSRGAFSEYVPGSQTMVLRGETNTAPVRYAVTKQTTIVDESGAPVTVERIPVGAPLSVQYTGTGDRLVASRIVVQRPLATTTTAPVTTTGPVSSQETTTTTTTSRPMSHHERHELKEAEEHRRKAMKEEIHQKKEALEKAEDEIDDH